jgi:hypothetical protein
VAYTTSITWKLIKKFLGSDIFLGNASLIRQTGKKAKIWEAKEAKYLACNEHAAAEKC